PARYPACAGSWCGGLPAQEHRVGRPKGSDSGGAGVTTVVATVSAQCGEWGAFPARGCGTGREAGQPGGAAVQRTGAGWRGIAQPAECRSAWGAGSDGQGGSDGYLRAVWSAVSAPGQRGGAGVGV